MKTNKQDEKLSAADLRLRSLMDKVYQAQDIMSHSTLAERDEATARWAAAQKAYNSELQRVAQTH